MLKSGTCLPLAHTCRCETRELLEGKPGPSLLTWVDLRSYVAAAGTETALLEGCGGGGAGGGGNGGSGANGSGSCGSGNGGQQANAQDGGGAGRQQQQQQGQNGPQEDDQGGSVGSGASITDVTPPQVMSSLHSAVLSASVTAVGMAPQPPPVLEEEDDRECGPPSAALEQDTPRLAHSDGARWEEEAMSEEEAGASRHTEPEDGPAPKQQQQRQQQQQQQCLGSQPSAAHGLTHVRAQLLASCSDTSVGLQDSDDGAAPPAWLRHRCATMLSSSSDHESDFDV